MILQTRSHPISLLNSPEPTSQLEAINHLPNPPLVPLAAEEIHVRRCRLAGNAIDGHLGCFRTSDLDDILKLAHGAPALMGTIATQLPSRDFSAAPLKHISITNTSCRIFIGRKRTAARKIFAFCSTAASSPKPRLPSPSTNRPAPYAAMIYANANTIRASCTDSNSAITGTTE